MRWLWLVLAACSSPPPRAPVANAASAPPAPFALTPARKFVLDGLGAELFGPDLVYARANDRGEVTACTNEPEQGAAFTTTCSIMLDDQAFIRLDGGLAVMQPDTSRDIDHGEQFARQPLADDLRRVRAHILPSSRAFTRACDAAGPVSCAPLGTTAAVDANGHLTLRFRGEVQGEIDLCEDKPARPDRAIVMVDVPGRHVLLMAHALGCPIGGFVMTIP